jgi:hypothetical protein
VRERRSPCLVKGDIMRSGCFFDESRLAFGRVRRLVCRMKIFDRSDRLSRVLWAEIGRPDLFDHVLGLDVERRSGFCKTFWAGSLCVISIIAFVTSSESSCWKGEAIFLVTLLKCVDEDKCSY